MKYCEKCGSKIEAGDMFCNNCGAKQFDESEKFTAGNNSGNLNSYRNLKEQVNFSDASGILLKMLLKPVSGSKQFIKNNEKGSVIGITIILTLMQGFLGVWKVNQVISSLQNMAVEFVQKIAGFMNLIEPGAATKLLDTKDIMKMTGEINKMKAFIKIPYGNIFIQNSVEFLIAIGILFIIIYLGTNILSKNSSRPFKIYKTALIVSVPALYFELFSIIVSYLSFYVGFGVSLIGIIISIVCLAIAIKESLDIDENHCAFIVSVSCIAVLIGVLACVQKFTAANISDVIMSVTNIMKNF